mgnify:CR=1 FL=1
MYCFFTDDQCERFWKCFGYRRLRESCHLAIFLRCSKNNLAIIAHITHSAKTLTVLHLFGCFQAPIASSYYSWCYRIVGFRESGFLEATFEENARKIGHFSLHYCLLCSILTVSARLHFFCACIVPILYSDHSCNVGLRENGFWQRKWAPRWAAIFVASEVPTLRKWPNLHARSRFLLFFEPGFIVWKVKRCWCIWGGWWRWMLRVMLMERVFRPLHFPVVMRQLSNNLSKEILCSKQTW